MGKRAARQRARAGAILATAIVASLLALVSAQSVSAADPAPDGTSEATAAPSCWAIKVNHPESADGAYWLLTPELGAPQRFHCDMTTDGGGWVLVGRGRNGWSWDHAGQGTPQQIVDVPSGPGAFFPATLHGDTIDALLGGTSVKDLDDGVRLRRAANPNGTSWQEVLWDFSVLDTWSWGFPGGMLLDSTTVAGTRYNGGNTRDSQMVRAGQATSSLRTQNNERRVNTVLTSSHGWQGGFAYGATVSNGSSSASSYLWESSNENNALPFTQVYIRPKLTDVTFEDLPAAGTPAQAISPLMQNTTEGPNQQWGVSGVMPGSSPDPNEVQAFTQIGNTVFVGGKFQYVQQGANGTRVLQSRLAAFDAVTGEWRSSFRPQMTGNVWALEATPDGRLIVGGEFSQVNGQPAGGLVALDPTTGATLSSWTANATPSGGSSHPWVRTLDLNGEWIYVGGRFNGIRGGVPLTDHVTLSGVSRVRWSDGRPDGGWKPHAPASVADLSVDETGSYVYLAGFFEEISGVATESVAKVSTSTPPVVTRWSWTPSASKSYQQAILAAGGKVYHGGSEHNIDAYDAATQQRISRNITHQGGDFQAVALIDGVIYAGCHCNNEVHADANNWAGDQAQAAVGASRTDSISYVGAFDANTLDPIPEFQVEMGMARGQGVWAIHHDEANDCMWLGGDMNRGSYVGGGWQWAGGFVRVCARDTTPPTTPTALSATIEGDGARLSWGAASDDRGVVGYEVLRDDRAIATVTQTSHIDPALDDGHRYAVRAIDAAGNRSASTPVEEVVPVPDDARVDLISAGADWSWRWETAAPPADWNSTSFDDSSWSTGEAPLGYGSDTLATTITGPSPRPIGVYFRHDFEVDDPSELNAVTLTTRADDGVVVYVNGTEVARSNMPDGPMGHNSYPLGSPRTAAAAANPVTVTVPPSLLQAGTNTISAHVALGYRNTRDVSFELTALGLLGSDEGTAPVAPTPLAELVSTDTVQLSWPAVDDAVAYRVRRDGAQVGFVAAPATTFIDSGLAGDTSYAYSVTAINALGNESAPGTATVDTPVDPTAPLVAAGADWAWRWETAAPPADWNSRTFDDSSWATGAAPLGYGSNGLGTTITGPSPRPIGSYFRHDFAVTDPAAISAVTITTRADDGVVVYVNGTEVGRANMPTGAIGHNSYPLGSPRTAPAAANPVTFTVPPGLLVAGQNTIAAHVALGYRNTTDISFDLSAVALLGTPDRTPPAAPVPSATLLDESSVEISWPAIDGAIAYRVARGGSEVGFVTAPATSFTEAGLARGVTHEYSVTTIGPFGNESAPAAVSIATPVDPTVPLVAGGSQWRWRWEADAPAADWTAAAFDDSTWATGAGPLGYGSNGLGTTITGPSPRPLAAYFRHTLDIADPVALSSVSVTTRVDDGVVIYVNGVEVGRSNMPDGPIGHNSYSLSSPNSTFAAANPVTFNVPMELLTAGTNTISAQVQLGYRNTRDASFELTALGIKA